MSSTAPWQAVVERSLEKNRAVLDAKYYQIATTGLDGRPSNRTVVHRGFLPGGKLCFVTDHRSVKVEEAVAKPWAEVAWYFPVTREQFRLSGRLVVVDHGFPDAQLLEERTKFWGYMSVPGRLQFFHPVPGQPRTQTNLADGKESLASSPLPPDTFDLVLLEVDGVDHVDLEANTRGQWVPQSGGWVHVEINP